MAKIREVCHHVRSKNAGPFWITVDLFFKDEVSYRQYRDAPSLGPELIGRLFETHIGLISRIPVDTLKMIKISYPRPHPQGWMRERDMHGGQQFVRLLDVDIG